MNHLLEKSVTLCFPSRVNLGGSYDSWSKKQLFPQAAVSLLTEKFGEFAAVGSEFSNII
jgi:hypothetical protein